MKSRFVIAFNDLSPIDLRRLCRMATPTRLVAPYVVVIPLVGDSFQAQHLYQKKKVCCCFADASGWGLLGFVDLHSIPIAQ